MPIPDESKFVCGETFEELAANINAYMEEQEWGIEPIDEQVIVDSINRYNELCATGADTEFGKRAAFLTAIENGPFYAVPRGANSLPAILGGLVVDENQQCLGADRQPIPGLFVAGNNQGRRFLVDYPVIVAGISLGTALTFGRLAGSNAAAAVNA